MLKTLRIFESIYGVGDLALHKWIKSRSDSPKPPISTPITWGDLKSKSITWGALNTRGITWKQLKEGVEL